MHRSLVTETATHITTEALDVMQNANMSYRLQRFVATANAYRLVSLNGRLISQPVAYSRQETVRVHCEPRVPPIPRGPTDDEQPYEQPNHQNSDRRSCRGDGVPRSLRRLVA